jgi:lipid-binding SYLF domain-containing protein
MVAKLHAEILSYSRSRGAFAGISLEGATLRPDEEANAELYGRKLTNEQIVMGKIKSPSSGSRLTAELNKQSARREAQKE